MLDLLGKPFINMSVIFKSVPLLYARQLANLLRCSQGKLLVIDCRSFLEYNDAHVTGAVNIGCSKLIKKRLVENKISIKELLLSQTHVDAGDKEKIVIYDSSSRDTSTLAHDNFVSIILSKLMDCFREVFFLQGGFEAFAKSFPEYCETRGELCFGVKASSVSTPCRSDEGTPPTKILPYMYLGSQIHAKQTDALKDCEIDYILNVSCQCPEPEQMQHGHYLRLPIRDAGDENILTWFNLAFDFIDKVREANGRVLIHCLAGISRSATIAIGYLIRQQGLTLDDAYRYVKDKRPTISPNLNFMGQLMEFEKRLKKEHQTEAAKALLRSDLHGLTDCHKCRKLHGSNMSCCSSEGSRGSLNSSHSTIFAEAS